MKLAAHPSLREVERITEHAWRRQHVREALTSLPAEQRLCLELAYFEGMSQRQIAERTATPVGTVKTRVRMGLEKLERILRAAGYRPEDIERVHGLAVEIKAPKP